MAEASVLPPAQYKQSSRKGKKAWRKHVDLTGIQEGLEEARQQIIDGGIVRELPADALFTSDTAGSTDIQTSYNRHHKPLKADQILAQRSAVPGLDLRKRREPQASAVVPSKKARLNNLTHKQYENLRRIAYGGQTVHKEVVQPSEDPTYDPWSVEAPVSDPAYDFLEKVKPINEPVTLKAAPITLATSGKKVRGVHKPAGEKSYNPTVDEWYVRLERVGEREVQRERKRLAEEERERERQEKIAQARAEEEAENEWASEWESEWEGIASEPEGSGENEAWRVKKRPERKTKAQRNRIKKRKEEEGLKKHEAQEKFKKQQTERIKALQKEVEQRESQRLAKKLAAVAADEDSSDRDVEDIELRKRNPFGKAPIPDAPLEVLLIEDLPDSLRTLRPEGNLLVDRYRSLVLQGKLDHRRPVQPKKKEQKFTEKWSYKDWTLAKDK